MGSFVGFLEHDSSPSSTTHLPVPAFCLHGIISISPVYQASLCPPPLLCPPSKSPFKEIRASTS